MTAVQHVHGKAKRRTMLLTQESWIVVNMQKITGTASYDTVTHVWPLEACQHALSKLSKNLWG